MCLPVSGETDPESLLDYLLWASVDLEGKFPSITICTVGWAVIANIFLNIAFVISVIVLHKSLKIQQFLGFLVPDLVVPLNFVWNIFVLAKVAIIWYCLILYFVDNLCYGSTKNLIGSNHAEKEFLYGQDCPIIKSNLMKSLPAAVGWLLVWGQLQYQGVSQYWDRSLQEKIIADCSFLDC